MTTRAKTWLALSLALNALLLGAVIGGGWMLTHQRGSAAVAGRLRAAGDGLSVAQQPRFRAMLRETRIAGKPLARRARQARVEAAAAIVTEPFDQAALTAALGRARDADLALRRQREEAIVGFAATLSPDDRRALAAGLGTNMLRGGRQRRALSAGAPSAAYAATDREIGS